MIIQNKSDPLYRDWLHLNKHLLWAYDHDVLASRGIEEPMVVMDSLDFGGAWLVRSGWAQVEYGNQVLRALPGQWLIPRPGNRLQSFAAETWILSLAFEAYWPDGTNWLEKGLPLVIDADDYPILERRARWLVKILKQPSDQWDGRMQRVSAEQFLELEKRLNEWFKALVQVLNEHGIQPETRYDIDDRIMRAVNLLDSHPLDKPLDREALASQVCLSLVHLTRLFARELHTSPWHYFEKRRFKHACDRLSMSNARIKDIAFGLGFNHLSNFSIWFKKTSGKSPRDYMKEAGTR